MNLKNNLISVADLRSNLITKQEAVSKTARLAGEYSLESIDKRVDHINDYVNNLDDDKENLSAEEVQKYLSYYGIEFNHKENSVDATNANGNYAVLKDMLSSLDLEWIEHGAEEINKEPEWSEIEAAAVTLDSQVLNGENKIFHHIDSDSISANEAKENVLAGIAKLDTKLRHQNSSISKELEDREHIFIINQETGELLKNPETGSELFTRDYREAAVNANYAVVLGPEDYRIVSSIITGGDKKLVSKP